MIFNCEIRIRREKVYFEMQLLFLTLLWPIAKNGNISCSIRWTNLALDISTLDSLPLLVMHLFTSPLHVCCSHFFFSRFPLCVPVAFANIENNLKINLKSIYFWLFKPIYLHLNGRLMNKLSDAKWNKTIYFSHFGDSDNKFVFCLPFELSGSIKQ